MHKKKLISINISLGKYQEFVDNILGLGKNHTSSYVCVSNVHVCIEAFRFKDFSEVVNNADIVTPDGMPLVKGLKWLYGIQQDKVSGPDLMPSLLKEMERQDLAAFFYGSTPGVLEKLNGWCKDNFPGLTIAGSVSPPFRKLSDEEIEQDVQIINQSGAHVVFVALGCPKQERWMAAMKGRINAVMIGVGGAFPMLVGEEKRAPLWMQKNMLEWLFRLMQDPKRLFKRYFVTNSYYIFLLTKEKLKLTFKI
ncbi:WecB/TagA/CpsF family glycosyltransferase [Emticicia sp. 21SJ11W-3]|uniref:WecB/TagA/CpsF family glycosyltransferase n=1 Tax=Emticicia sp. 21SJ11W-3 TaxID=2916755 RepID=UPI00209DB0C0|nr:WecB/TagA/CpsF family glycosyltransferase [Emticicia sp. 21SJ11W-3]UTA68672.1 WecB/TagA/CpsF family glycosyltransferase [Emticicia sp. 21SJ11W-3]